MKKNRSELGSIHILCIVASLLVVVPLLIIGHYNYPIADDWSLSLRTHAVVENGGSLFEVLEQAFQEILSNRIGWEPRYSSVFFAALQPGIWGEHFYRITPWLMIGSLFASEIMLFGFLLKDTAGSNRKWILPIITPTLLIQMLCVPYPVETFYWYTAAVNYTFLFSLSLVLLVIFLKLWKSPMSKWKTTGMIIAGCVLACIVGGNNYATSLSSVCTFAALTLVMMFSDRKALMKTLPITVIITVGLILCVVAPGNQARMAYEFEGRTMGAVSAIVMSLARTGMNIYSWTSLKIIIMIVLVLPFIWKAVKVMEYTFKFPVLFTAFTFGIYASQIVATMYVGGDTGGRRMADILYYAYHIWVMLNTGYWVGWLQRKLNDKKIPLLKKTEDWITDHKCRWFVCVGLCIAVTICVAELKTLSTYQACAWLIKGEAKEYAQAWEERLAVLHDDTVKEVFFAPLPGCNSPVFYTDLEYGDLWINNICEQYYEKDHVSLK